MRIAILSLWAVPISLAHAATTGNRHGFRRVEKRQESAAAQTTPKFEGLRISYITETQLMTETQTLQVTIAADPVVLTQIVTQVAEAAPVTVTETVIQPVTATKVITVAAEAATITMTETVAGTCAAPAASGVNGGVNSGQNGVGVSTIPLAQSLLPTTTFSFDPLATSATSAAAVITSSISAAPPPSSASSAPPVSSASSASSSATSTSTSTSTTSIQTMASEIIMTRTTTAQGQATSLVPSVDLGGLQPDASAELGSIVQGSATSASSSAPSSTTRAGINIPSLSLSSVLSLGNLAPATAGIAARATHAA